MPGQLIARGQVTIHTQTDSYTITQSAGEYIFNAANDGSIQDQTTITSAVKVAQGGQQITDFTIGSISRPAGFAAIMVDNTLKTITYRINAGTKTLPDSGVITIPVNIAGVTYHLSFVWSKAKTGADGPSGVATLPEWLEEWDSGKTQINGNYVITPKLFAGVKNANGTITGTAIGKFSILTRNGQGQFQSEEVNGIYGFRDGYKTFSVDTTGSVELGRGEQSIKYDAATGKIEFGAAVALQWKGATYIDANGIFTGTLSADTINAIQINASQITAGTIHADLIDTAALKAELITASNIEALTLNVVRGTIGGWTIDADSIFRGDKNNLSGSYTSLSESITIGSNGIRGKAWRLESTGAGSVAGGNITWDINGNVTFGPSVSLYWINAAAEALESAKEDAAQKMDSAKELAQAMAYGRMLYRDPSFYNGTNGMAIYNSSTGNKLTISRIADSAAPNDSKYVVSLKNTGTTSPDCGGFSWKTQTQYRKVFITRIIARLPINRSLEFITNNVGTGGSHKWLTSNAGTGEWTEYIHKVSCGTANFSTTHYFYLSGAVGSSGSPVEWRIAYATVFDITSSEKLTTTIDADGIYTGILTAQQVNAVDIAATSIKTGFLNSDRIAAGSIKAEKLDAASIKAGIINTDYINGLTLNFERGNIGGWSIDSQSIWSGNIGVSGDTAVQIRSSTTGSGNFYSGTHRLHGISLTWLQPSNAGFVVFGQVGSTASTIKTGYFGIQMMDYLGYEYFCLSANTALVGAREVYNRIAGWAFDHQKIWKNNVTLSADGSITSGTMWKLNNDGSGQIAGGNISWNAAGEVSFSAAVSMNWLTITNRGKLYVRGTAFNRPAPRIVTLNGEQIISTSTRGLTLTVINRTSLVMVSSLNYDVYASDTNCNTLAAALNALSDTVIVILTSYDTIRINGTLNTAIQRCGGTDLTLSDSRTPYAFIGIPGIGKNNGLVASSGVTATDPYAELTTTIINGVPQGVNLGSRRMTYIDGNGIYTGTLTAQQVNAVNISASSITTGTLSTDRIAAGSINASKLDADSIKANIINTQYISGLSLNFVQGTIGGWTIAAGSLYSGQILLDSTNRKIVVYATGATSGQRVQLYYNSQSDFGLYATDASGTIVARFGSQHQIAGWIISPTQITKNSVSLGADGSITSGVKWRLNNDGSGQIASGNITWDAAGNVSFGSAVVMNWQTGINLASDMARAMAFGKMLYRYPEFYYNGGINYNSTNNYLSYATRSIVAVSGCPNSTGYALQYVATNWNSASDQRIGGFCFMTPARANAVFVARIIAKIPVGRYLDNYHNYYGTGGTSVWLTSNAGTGNWQEYICKVTCGSSGSFTTINHFALTGGTAPTSSVPVTWQIAYATVFDITSAERYLTTINADGIYTGKISAGQVNVDSALIVGGSTYNGSISVRDASNVVKVTLDRNGINAVGGKIGGWSINSTQIYSGSVILNSNGSIQNSTRWQLNYDGSGRLASGNITWTAAGVLNVKNAIITDVTIKGTLRAPFVKYDGSIWIVVGGGSSSDTSKPDAEKYDNLSVIAGMDSGGWYLQQPELPWTKEQSGRRLCLVHYRYGSEYAYGTSEMTAPSGQYFYENGLLSSKLKMSREVVELMGFGTPTQFYGWIVLNRRDIGTQSRYGHYGQYLAMGTVTLSGTSASIRYKTYDGGTMSVSRAGVGAYYIYMPWSLGADKYMVMMTGRATTSGGPIYASMRGQYSSYFYVYTGDDSTANEGSFNFIVVSTADFV